MNEISDSLEISSVPRNERESLELLLAESFSGWYLWHSKRMLRDVEEVRAAQLDNQNVGLMMLKTLDDKTGYIYYVAVSPKYRNRKIGARLVDNSLEYFSKRQAELVYAAVSEDNEESRALFRSKGFRETNFSESTKKYGIMNALTLYRKMTIVSGEILLYKEIVPLLD